MMSSYENAFLNHIQLDKRINKETIENPGRKSAVKDGYLQKHDVRHRILRKYRRNWWKFYSVRKKKNVETNTLRETSAVQSEPTILSLSRSWPSLGTKDNSGNTLFPEANHEDKILFRGKSLDSAEIQNRPFCTEFPIAEIGSELSGNRGNGNSPFNSSNSCGSPEGLFSTETNHKTTVSSKADEKDENGKMCTKCFRELNNNLEQIKSNPSKEVCACGSSPASVVESRQEKSNFTDIIENEHDDVSDMDNEDTEDDEIDEEEEDDDDDDESDEFSDVKESREKSLENTLKIEDVTRQSPSPVQYVGSNTSHRRKPAPISPVKWQQQFMSFLSALSPPPQEEIQEKTQEEIEEEIQDPIVHDKEDHSPRRKRSRSIRNSTCSCCISPSSKKSKHMEEKHRPKRLTRQQKHFIRDMVQLVSLRNKILKLLLTLFPACAEELNRLNADTDSIDSYIDQIINAIKTPDKILFADDRADFCPDKKCIENVPDSKEFNDRVFLDAEYPSLIRSPVLDEQHRPNTSNAEENDNDINSRDMPVLDRCELAYAKSEETLEASQENMSLSMCSIQTFDKSSKENEEGNDAGRRILSNDSGILLDMDESQTENVKEQFHEADLVKEEAKCDIPISCDSPVERRAKYLGIDVAVVSSAHSNNDQEVDSIQSIMYGELTSDSNSAGISKSIQDSEKRGNEGNSDLTKKDRTDITRLSLFDKLMEDNLTSAGRSDPIIRLSAAIESPKKEETSAILPSSCLQPSVKSQFPHAVNGSVQLSLFSAKDTHSSQSNACQTPHGVEIESLCKVEGMPTKVIEVYDSQVQLCREPKLCLKSLKRRVLILLYWLLPELALENNFLKNVDNLEYLLDAIIFSNQKPLTVEV